MKLILTWALLLAHFFVFGQFSARVEGGMNLIPGSSTWEGGKTFHTDYNVSGNVEFKINKWVTVSTGLGRTAFVQNYTTDTITSIWDNDGLTSLFGLEQEDMDSLLGGFFNTNAYETTYGTSYLKYISIPLQVSITPVKGLHVSYGVNWNILNSALSKKRTETYAPFLDALDSDSLDPVLSLLMNMMFAEIQETKQEESSSVSEFHKSPFGHTLGLSYRFNPYLGFGLSYSSQFGDYRSRNRIHEGYKTNQCWMFNLQFVIPFKFRIPTNSEMPPNRYDLDLKDK